MPPASAGPTCSGPAWAAWWPRNWPSTHPERVDGLVLACTTPGWPFAYPMPGATVACLSHAEVLGPADGGDRWPDGRGGDAPPHGECPVRPHRAAASGTPRPPHRAPARPARGPGSTAGPGRRGCAVRRRPRQRRIGARTLVLQGAADTVVDPRNARLLADRIPGATWATAGAACWSPGSGPARPWPTTAPTASLAPGTLGVSENDPTRYTWEFVAPADPDHMDHTQRMLHVVADRLRWQNALNEARR